MRRANSPELFPVLIGAGLTLRELQEDDLQARFARLSDREAAALTGDPVATSFDVVMEGLVHHRRAFAEHRVIRWEIVPDEEGVSVGTIGLVGSAAHFDALDDANPHRTIRCKMLDRVSVRTAEFEPVFPFYTELNSMQEWAERIRIRSTSSHSSLVRSMTLSSPVHPMVPVSALLRPMNSNDVSRCIAWPGNRPPASHSSGIWQDVLLMRYSIPNLI